MRRRAHRRCSAAVSWLCVAATSARQLGGPRPGIRLSGAPRAGRAGVDDVFAIRGQDGLELRINEIHLPAESDFHEKVFVQGSVEYE